MSEQISIYEHCVRYLRRKRVTEDMTAAELEHKAKQFERDIGADWAKMLAASREPGPVDGYPHTALGRVQS